MNNSTILPKCARESCKNRVKRKDKKYCSISCGTIVRNQKMYPKRKELTCEQCGKSYSTKPAKENTSRFCSAKCRHKHQKSLVGEKHHNFNSIRLTCTECNTEFTCQPFEKERRKFCSQKCRRKFHKSKLPFPRVNIDYGQQWTNQKRKCLERDNYTCQHCGKNKRELGRNPDVHHKIPFRISKTNRLTNLITLCNSCHKKADAAYNRKHSK